jgi:hypothetical protein
MDCLSVPLIMLSGDLKAKDSQVGHYVEIMLVILRSELVWRYCGVYASCSTPLELWVEGLYKFCVFVVDV